MKPVAWIRSVGPEVLVLSALALYPLLGIDDDLVGPLNFSIGEQLTTIFVYAILALGLNVVVGYAGLLHLGIAAFFGIGAYVTGILTVPSYPFQFGFLGAIVCATVASAAAGLILGAPTLRLRGDYLAIVTLGFGEVVRFSIRNLESITGGTRALNPIPPPVAVWAVGFEGMFYVSLGLLIAVVLVLRNLEVSRLGRAWMAVREDELAASCMGVNPARVKLAAFAVGTALAGLAGCLYATVLGSTSEPDNSYGFNRSIVILGCIILGGLGSIRGTLLGVLLLIGYDNVLLNFLDSQLQKSNLNPNDNPLLSFSSWKLMVFGLVLILTMRFRPEGLLPSQRVKRELHGEGTPL